MIRNGKSSRKLVSTLGLSILVALGLMAFSAAGAQASEWTVGGKTLKELGMKSETFESNVSAFKFAWGGIEISCSEHGTGTIYPGGTSTSQVTLSKCKIPGAEEACKVKNVPVEREFAGTLSKDGTYESFTSMGGSNVATFTVEEGSESCILLSHSSSETVYINGSFAGEVGADAIQTPLIFSQAIENAAKTAGLIKGLESNMWALHPYTKGTGTQKLTGANSGKSWGAV
jgi:hypothetical protein